MGGTIGGSAPWRSEQLTQRQVAEFLVRRKLVAVDSVVDGDLVVMDSSRRNCNFEVITANGPCYLLKQSADLRRTGAIAHEAAVYECLLSHAGDSGFQRYLVPFYGFDAEYHIIILGLLRGAQDLREYHARHGRLPVTLAAQMGEALGTLHHDIRMNGKNGDANENFHHRPPGMFWIHRPDSGIFRDMSSANIQLIKVIQEFKEFCGFLDDLRQEWVTDTLIHFDIKWDNFLISERPAPGRGVELKLVDWELAGVGDPCWDVGSIFSDFLSTWLLSIPMIGEIAPERFPGLARHPISKMQPAISAFWRSYIRRMGLDPTASAKWLLRATKYAAGRLVQTAFEQMQTSTRLSRESLYCLQLSLNILRRPQEAIVHLLGITSAPATQ